MSKYLNRRKFLKNSFIVSASAAAGLSFEHEALLARNQRRPSVPIPEGTIKGLPMGRIGKHKFSRLIIGGNLISGFAHSRDLIYVSSLLKYYFTDEKVFETLRMAEENGINTTILNTRNETVRVFNKYRKETGGKIQWIAQTYPSELDLTSSIQKAIDNGAIGAFIQGGHGDKFIKDGRVDLIGKVISFIKKNGLIAGVGSHSIDVPIAVEKEGIEPDFYFKTLNNVNYQSDTPEKTIEFMKKVKKPWIAFKVLGAGATHPRKGFEYAFKNGADFICVGIFDFQIKEDIIIAKRALSNNSKRERPWIA